MEWRGIEKVSYWISEILEEGGNGEVRYWRGQVGEL